MTRRSLALLLLPFGLWAGCSTTYPKSPAETQAGAASDLDVGPRSGAAPASCRDLPSAAQLTQWLRAAPGVQGEAGGLFSGKREWASVVDRRGEICATAVALDDPDGAWPGSQAIA